MQHRQTTVIGAILAVMVVVVLGSVVIHGLIAPSAAARWSRTEN